MYNTKYIGMYWNNVSPHNSNYVVFLRLNHQAKPLDFPAVFRSGGHNIDPRCINAAVPQNICQLCDIFLNAIESPGKQLAQIVGENLGRIDTRCFAQPFHLRPNIAAVQRLSIPCNENSPAPDPAFLGII